MQAGHIGTMRRNWIGNDADHWKLMHFNRFKRIGDSENTNGDWAELNVLKGGENMFVDTWCKENSQSPSDFEIHDM
jgi:hypothetical protein